MAHRHDVMPEENKLHAAMRLQVSHTTRYQYSEPVSHSVNEVCLVPRATHNQICESSVLDIFPTPDYLETVVDVYGNLKSHFHIESPHIECRITAHSVARLSLPELASNADNSAITNDEIIQRVNAELPAGEFTERTHADCIMAQDCLLPSHYISRSAVLDAFVSKLEKLIDFSLPAPQVARSLGEYIYNNFTYDANFSTVVTPLHATVESQRGVCQDFAHLAIAVLRSKQIPARYVSGYLETIPPPGQEKLRGADASHAWYSVYAPESGWSDFDPTNNQQPGSGYVTTAWGRDYADVAPLRGMVTGGGQHQLSVAVDVEPLAAPTPATSSTTIRTQAFASFGGTGTATAANEAKYTQADGQIAQSPKANSATVSDKG